MQPATRRELRWQPETIRRTLSLSPRGILAGAQDWTWLTVRVFILLSSCLVCKGRECRSCRRELTHRVLSHCFQFKYAHAIHVRWSSATFKRCMWHRPIRTPATAESSMTIRSVQHCTNRAPCVDPKLLQTPRPWQDRKDREEAIAHVFTTLQDRQRNTSYSPTTVRLHMSLSHPAVYKTPSVVSPGKHELPINQHSRQRKSCRQSS